MVMCVCAIFLFPAVHGPYSVVHGPVTALRSSERGLRLRLATAQAALSSFGRALPHAWLAGWNNPLADTEARPQRFSEETTILRC